MSTCFVAAIVKGVIEYNDAGKYFGSFGGIRFHIDQAVADGVIEAYPDVDKQLNLHSLKVTDLGRNWYQKMKLNELPEWRAYFWRKQDWKITTQ